MARSHKKRPPEIRKRRGEAATLSDFVDALRAMLGYGPITDARSRVKEAEALRASAREASRLACLRAGVLP